MRFLNFLKKNKVQINKKQLSIANDANKAQSTFDKRKIIVVNADFGMGGISKSLIEWLDLVDYSKYEITLYIRRNDALELLPLLNKKVNLITVDSELKKGLYDNSFLGKFIKLLCEFLEKLGRKYLAKQIYRLYKYPKQRKLEGDELNRKGLCFDTAIAYSTADDIPVFVLEHIKADKKYLFIHQSTAFSKENQKTLPLFDGVVAVSDTLCQKLKNDFSNPKIAFISLPNYVSHSRVIKMANEETVNSDSNILHLVTCGRLVDVKGYDLLLDTAEKLKKQKVDFVWDWVGDGKERKKMEAGISKKDLKEEVHILGEKMNPYPYIASCDIYIQPSKAEAFALTIFEALSLGKMVVSTKTVGGEYILTKYNCGKLVDISANDIAKSIVEFATNAELLEMETKKIAAIDWENEELSYKNKWDELLSGRI